MTLRVEGGLTYTQTFDAENRLISVAVGGQTTQFIYDGDGNVVKKINPNNSKTLYVRGIYSIPFGDEVDKASGGSVTRTVTYYPVGGATPALHRTHDLPSKSGASVRSRRALDLLDHRVSLWQIPCYNRNHQRGSSVLLKPTMPLLSAPSDTT